MATEEVTLNFTDDGVAELAAYANRINKESVDRACEDRNSHRK